MRHYPVKLWMTLVVVGLLAGTAAWGDEWVYYGASGQVEPKGSTLRDWYGLNRLACIPKAGAATYHFYDRDSLASNSPFPGGIVRVWEKSILQKETESYEEAREAIAKEEQIRLKREINVLDYAWLFPRAVNRATKEATTLFEINCDSREFFILEGNNYDKAGQRMTREATFDMDLWLPIQQQTVMEALYQAVCK